MHRHFAIVCMGRTGSTMLVHLLNSHPRIECRGELFNPEKGEFRKFAGMTPSEFLERHAYETDLPIRGFKMPTNWIAGYHPGAYEDFRRLGYRLVILSRDDALEHFVSLELAKRNGWEPSQPYREQRLVVDLEDFADFLRIRKAEYDGIRAGCIGLETFDVEYTRLPDPATHERMLEFLGAPVLGPLTTTTVKRRTRPIQEVVTNYEEALRVMAAAGDAEPGSGPAAAG